MENARKIIHMIFGTIIIAVAFFFGAKALSVLCLSCFLIGVTASLLIKKGIELPVFSLAVELFGRKTEKMPGYGTLMFMAGAFTAGLISFFSGIESIAFLALMPAVYGDGVATIIGKKFGKHRIAGKKTFEGSASFLIASFTALFIATGKTTLSAVIAAIAMLAELPPWDDNLIIPVTTAVFLYIIL